LRDRALAEIEATSWVPPWGQARIHGMIANRPDWVLSRQRTWGVPIPTFYCTACKEPHADAATMDHVATLFGSRGADAWWTTPVAELVPPGTRCGSCGAAGDQFEREQDIVDVWFESGVSWLAMRAKDPATHGEKPGRKPIDLYLEGSDQHRGWFHSSLLAGVIVRGGAPYREVITHGFVLDERGKEYSKSTIAKAKAAGIKTDYIEPDDVIAKSGAEMFRMWVASVEYRNDMTYSQTILTGLGEWYRKFRNTARFVLGAINDYTPFNPKRVDFMAMRAVDRYMLGRIADLVRRCRDAYDKYEHHLVHRALVDFVTIDLSAFYSDIVKDRLYCDPIDSDDRRAVQVVLHRAIEALAVLASPILVFTADDIWRHMPHEPGEPASVHLARFSSLEHADPAQPDFARILAVRDAVLKQLEAFRAAKHKSTDARVTIHAPAADRAVLERHAGELAEIFIVSEVVLAPASTELRVEVAAHSGPRCERCWRHFGALSSSPDYADVCERCERALRARRSKS
jgi:isoleucyl-tRNA synthetase